MNEKRRQFFKKTSSSLSNLCQFCTSCNTKKRHFKNNVKLQKVNFVDTSNFVKSIVHSPIQQCVYI